MLNMKLLQTFTTTSIVLVSGIHGAAAEREVINWPTVLIAWIFSVISYAIIYGICFGVSKVLKRNRRKQRGLIDRDERARASGRSGASGVTLISSRPAPNARPLHSSGSYSSTRHSGSAVPEDVALINRPIHRSVSEEVEARNRRRATDFTSKWCTKHNLSENTANVLRENGFRNEATLRALKAEDVSALCLPSKAEEVLLREVLVRLQQTSYRKNTYSESSKSPSYKYSVSTSSRKAASSTDLNPHSASSTPPDASTSLLDKAYSENEMEECGMAEFKEGLPRNKSTAHSFDVIDEGNSMFFGASSSIELQGANGVNDKIVSPVLTKQQSKNDFNGILSDKGLHALAKKIGGEWQHLATLLNVPNSIIDQIKLDNQGRTRHQIYEMLKLFRDSASGTKEQIKGTLQVALETIGRRDLANEMLQEQVDGSVEKIPYHSIV